MSDSLVGTTIPAGTLTVPAGEPGAPGPPGPQAPIMGVTDGSDAGPGEVGEVLFTTTVTTIVGSQTVFDWISGTQRPGFIGSANTSLTLTPGDWDVTQMVSVNLPMYSWGMDTQNAIYIGNVSMESGSWPGISEMEGNAYQTLFASGPTQSNANGVGATAGCSIGPLKITTDVDRVIQFGSLLATTSPTTGGTPPFTFLGDATMFSIIRARRMR